MATPAVIRVAGLPAAAMDELRFEKSFELAGVIAGMHRQLETTAHRLSVELFHAVGKCVAGPEKAALVGLRRAVHGLRPPTSREWNEHVAGLLPDGVATGLAQWLRDLRTYQAQRAALPPTLQQECAAKVDVLREIVADEWFQRALSDASPALFDTTAKWLIDRERRPRMPSLVRLAKYAARAAAKTSPYSTFTISGWGGWSAGGPRTSLYPLGDATGVVELHGFLLAALRSALRDDPKLSASLPLRLNPSATRVEGTVRFLGRPPTEPIVTVRATPAVLNCVRLLDGDTALTRAELRAGFAVGTAGEGKLDRLIDRLLEVGLLDHPLPGADLSGDPLGDLLPWLTASGADDLATAIDDVRSRLQRPLPVPAADHAANRRALGAALGELSERMALPTERVADRQMDLWHENAVFSEPIGALSAPLWGPALADLDVVRRVLAVLDPALPTRVALGAYCGERFGPGSTVPFLTVQEAIMRDAARFANVDDDGSILHEITNRLTVTGRLATPPLRESRVARLRELARIERELWEQTLASTDAGGVIRADPEALLELAGTWPSWIAAPVSIACYLQVIPDGGLVVNVVHGGQGRGRSRVLHLIRQAGGSAPADDLRRSGRPVAAELGGLFAFGPNARLAGAPYEIDYPFVVSGRPSDQRLSLRDLVVRHDPRTGMTSLFSRELGAPVQALHLGMLADFQLPPAACLLTEAFGCGYLVFAGAPMFVSTSAVDALGVTRFPRVAIGRVVVRRARWVVRTALVPVRANGESDAELLQRMVEWLRDHGIPDRCFVRLNDPTVLDESRVANSSGKARKPVYVDFANWFLVVAFERMLATAGPAVTFEEALPALADAPGPDDRPGRVTEFLVEICGDRRGNG